MMRLFCIKNKYYLVYKEIRKVYESMFTSKTEIKIFYNQNGQS